MITSDEFFLSLMQRVLASGVSDGAKIMYCRLICIESVRRGWRYGDPRWTNEEYGYLAELVERKYLSASKGCFGLVV